MSAVQRFFRRYIVSTVGIVILFLAVNLALFVAIILTGSMSGADTSFSVRDFSDHVVMQDEKWVADDAALSMLQEQSAWAMLLNEDPNAVYGYKPKKDGSLKNFANVDWSDLEFVESARQKRIQYIEDDRSICDLVSDMKNKGCSTEEIAHSICDYRNQTRLNSYLDLDGNIINENGYNAALERMQTRSYDALISSGKTPEQIISSSMRTNPAMDACVGLYDENFNSY